VGISGVCPTSPDVPSGTCASVTFDGESFVVAWRAPSIPGDASSLDLCGARVATGGTVSPRFVISAEADREGAPVLAAGGPGRVLAAYTRFVPGAPYDTRRAQARLLASEGLPGPDAGPPGPAPERDRLRSQTP
jgi:hypothetical protein